MADLHGFDPDEDLLAQILALNLSVAELEQAGGAVRGPGRKGWPTLLGQPRGSSPFTGSCDRARAALAWPKRSRTPGPWGLGFDNSGR
jgi:hypothetical protein